MECMVCYEAMTTWNSYSMTGCSHTICIECAEKIRTKSDTSSITSVTSDEYEDFDSPEESTLEFPIRPFGRLGIAVTINYTLKGYNFTYFNHITLYGYNNSMQCPYCREYEHATYNFDLLRFCIPRYTMEWNIIERKLYKDRLRFFTMSKNGMTFAFKLFKNKSLHIMWSEVDICAWSNHIPQTHTYSEIRVSKKYVRTYKQNPRTYKQNTKMLR